MEIFDPTISAEREAFSYARRPKDLQGLRVGLVENTKYNSEAILRRIAERLDERYKVKLVHVDHKKSSSHSVNEEAIAALKGKADFVVAGVGD
jgi:RNase H-fold protein (predicted Holliday junction resolvase)